MLIFVTMAYNRNNYLKQTRYIVEIYNSVKECDKPDSHIVRFIFPKHNIFLSYRTWMNIKNMKSSELNPAQATLFN